MNEFLNTITTPFGIMATPFLIIAFVALFPVYEGDDSWSVEFGSAILCSIIAVFFGLFGSVFLSDLSTSLIVFLSFLFNGIIAVSWLYLAKKADEMERNSLR